MQQRKPDWKRLLAWVLFTGFVLSIVYAVIQLMGPPNELDGPGIKRDYMLMILQCALGIVVMLLPTYIQRKWSVPISDFIYISYYAFLFCGIFLGEVFFFYYRVGYWDTLLHFYSGAMIAALGFYICELVAKNKGILLPPILIACFAFSLSMAAEAVWEIYEFIIDSIMDLNMQKYMTEAGEALIGQEALADTMKDIYVNGIGAAIAAVIGYRSMKRKRKEMAETAREEAA